MSQSFLALLHTSLTRVISNLISVNIRIAVNMATWSVSTHALAWFNLYITRPYAVHRSVSVVLLI